MTSVHRMFVYGTLKRAEPNSNLLSDVESGHVNFVGRGRTADKWPMVIASSANIPFILYNEGKGNNIVGEVYDVSDAVLEKLDELEDHPDFYERVQRKVILESPTNGENEAVTTTCWIYFLKSYKPYMMGLPFLDNYSSYGPHGLQYVKRYTTDENEANTVQMEVCQD